MADDTPGFSTTAAQQFQQGFNNPVSLANALARLRSNQAQAPQMTNVQDPSLLSYEQQAQSTGNPHLANMQQAAEDAKQKYMRENGVDENGDPVSK